MVLKREEPWQRVILETRSSKNEEKHKIDFIEEAIKWY
jgi:hypothetical protein